MNDETVNTKVDDILAVVRLGDVDRYGWWRSHSLDETAEYILGESFPSTWMATGVELAMESSRVRHEQLLGRSTAVHLFSDYLPFHRLLRSWLIERKLERDPEPLEWLRTATTEELRARLPGASAGEQRADGLFLGEVTRAELDSPEGQARIRQRLTGAFAPMGSDFLAPYMDLVSG